MKQIVKFEEGSIMLLSCITIRGLDDFQRIEGYINVEDYVVVL